MRKNSKIDTKIWTMHDRLYYFKENNYKGFLLLLFVLVNLLVFIIMAVAVHLLPDNNGLTLKEILWKSLSYMLDSSETGIRRSIINTSLFFWAGTNRLWGCLRHSCKRTGSPP